MKKLILFPLALQFACAPKVRYLYSEAHKNDIKQVSPFYVARIVNGLPCIDTTTFSANEPHVVFFDAKGDLAFSATKNGHHIGLKVVKWFQSFEQAAEYVRKENEKKAKTSKE